jgi:hypothetical protein
VDPLTFLRSQPDRALAALSGVIGIVLLVDGWYGVSGQGIVAGQIPYLISCGLGGIFALATATTLWLSADLRDEWRKMDAVEAAVLAQTEVLRSLQAGSGMLLSVDGHGPEPIGSAADGRAARHRVGAAQSSAEA